MNALQKYLKSVNVCDEAIEWAGQFKGRNAHQRAWDACENGNWLQFYAWRVNRPAWNKMDEELMGSCVNRSADEIRKYFPEMPK